MKERNYGVDLLRIVSMAMIAMLHVLGHGGVLNASVNNVMVYSLAWLLEVGAYCAVNCYALISGYVGYGGKFKYSNIIVVLASRFLDSCIYGYICCFGAWFSRSEGFRKSTFPVCF